MVGPQTFWIALAASLLAGGVTTLGILSIRRFSGWGKRNISFFICFAAGVLIGATFLHLIPESFSRTAQAPVWILAGFFGLHLFNRFFSVLVCEGDPARKDYAVGVIPMVAIGLHSIVDGMIYSVTFSVSLFTGYLAAIGLILHEFPEGIITYLLLVRGGFTPRTALLSALLAAAATTPAGMLASWPYISTLDDPILGALLSLSAGALVYVGATHLLPRAEMEARHFSMVALAGGVLVAVISVAMGP